MSEISTGGGLGRSLTGEVGEFGEDDTVRLRANVRMAFVLCVFALAAGALALVLLV